MIELFNRLVEGAANAVVIAAGLSYLWDRAGRRRLRRLQQDALQAQAYVPLRERGH